ncbi:hypothetical protein AB0C33_36050 [Nonomuraea sp. NPDC048881]|uniref:hypothetical protein n=1 Tax=unclassified Nonomuraea TaxID=2593643 RepID=UPI0033FD0C71
MRDTTKTYRFSPYYTCHDDGVDLCFYSVQRTKGTTLRGLCAEMARGLIQTCDSTGTFSRTLLSDTLPGLPPDRWDNFIEELARRGILIPATAADQDDAEDDATVILTGTHGSEQLHTDLHSVLKGFGLAVHPAEIDDLTTIALGGRTLVIFADDGYDVAAQADRPFATVGTTGSEPATP